MQRAQGLPALPHAVGTEDLGGAWEPSCPTITQVTAGSAELELKGKETSRESPREVKGRVHGGVWVGAAGRGLVLKRHVSLHDCFRIVRICESHF